MVVLLNVPPIVKEMENRNFKDVYHRSIQFCAYKLIKH